jgi:hypothetical protein
MRFLLATLAALTTTSALAADVSATILPPAAHDVDAPARYQVRVANSGGQARNVSVTIDLPQTNTSPQVYLMGTLVARDSRCALSAQTLTCSLGKLNGGQSKTVWFDVAFPYSAEPLLIEATADTTSSDSNPGNDYDAVAAALTYVDVPLAGDTAVFNEHCTGQGLSSFFECERFPSSITAHDAILHDDGSISFPGQDPGYAGAWWQAADDHLGFTYTYAGTPVAEFDGAGVDGDCFEGLTTFPDSPYVSPYRVCR